MSLILSGTDGLSDVDGSAATPAIRGTDANTGIFFPAADTIAFSEGGAEAMRIDSSGNVGIGTSSPTLYSGYKTVAINGTTGGLVDFLSNGTLVGEVFNTASDFRINGASTYPIVLVTNGSERMRIDPSGNLLVGKTAADATTAGSAILPAYGGANIPAMTLAGASSSNSQLGYHQYSTSAAAFRFYVGYGGTVYATSTTITGISDQRLKEKHS